MEYKEAVAEIRRLDQVIEEAEEAAEEARWGQARLATEVIEGGSSLRQLAADIGKSHSTVGRWAALWRRFGADQHQGYTYGEAWEIISHPDYKLDELPPGEVFTGRRNEQARRTVHKLPPEQKAAVVREALQDEQVAERVIRDTPTRARLAQTEHRIDREQQETARERYELAEPRSVQIGAMADLEYAATKARTAFEDVREAADKLAAYNWPDDNRERSEALVQRAMAAGELALAAIRGQDLDEELKALVEGGDA